MRSKRGLVIGIVTATTWACGGSVNPVVPDAAAIFEPELLGTWSDSAWDKRAVIVQIGPRRYGIQYGGQELTVSLVGVLGRSRERFILDVQPSAAALRPYQDYVVPLHTPVILSAIGPRIQVTMLQPDSLSQYLWNNPTAIAHFRTRETVVATASSAALAQFFETYLQRPGVLGSTTTWIRRSP